MSVFSVVGGARPQRTVFDLSYKKMFNCNFFELIPVLCDECVPGDSWRIGNQLVCRFEPQVAPFFSDVWLSVDYFFVPYRILDENWEKFITGGELIDDPRTGHEGEKILEGDLVDIKRYASLSLMAQYSFEDYIGLPLGKDLAGVCKYPVLAYNQIWNEFYRDENLQDERTSDDGSLAHRAWSKDYFTSALPFQQKGISPSFNLTGEAFGNLVNDVNLFKFMEFFTSSGTSSLRDTNWSTGIGRLFPSEYDSELFGITQQKGYVNLSKGMYHIGTDPGVNDRIIASLHNYSWLPPTRLNPEIGVHVELNDTATTGFDINDLRFAFQVQKFFERNARAGSRYTEFLRAQYGVSPRDDRLQRPEFIGRTTTKLVTSEVLQTSATGADGTAQGNMAGHTMNYSTSFAGRYFCQEFGLIMGLLSVCPVAEYYQGVNRQWLRRNRYDFANPLFVNLSEQGIYEGEIYWQADATKDYNLFGFQGIFDEMRVKQNMVCADFRPRTLGTATGVYKHWTLARDFASAPNLNSDFVKGNIANPRIFAYQSAEQPKILMHFANLLKCKRPLPYLAEPGLIDHH